MFELCHGEKTKATANTSCELEDAVKHINCINFLFHHHISIDFRGVDVGMPQHLTCGVDVTSCCQDEGGKGMTAAMHNLSKSNVK